MRLVRCRAAVLGALAMAVMLPSPHVAWAQDRAAQVVVDRVVTEPLSQTTPVLGRFVARQSGSVAALIGGPVEEVLVDIGDRVAKGEVLVRLSTAVTLGYRNLRAAELREKEAALQTARAEAELAGLELQRLESLKKSAAFSQARYEDKRAEVARFESRTVEAEASVARARANLELADLDLARAEIRAPYNGVVIARHVAVGAHANSGSAVVNLVNDEDMEIEADVPADKLAGLFPGRGVRVLLDDGRNVMATVRSVIPAENPLTRTRPVRFSLRPITGTGQPLATDQSATVMIPVGEIRDVVTVHKDAVIARGTGDIVFRVEDGKAQIREIRLGEAVGPRVEVLSGLEPEDIVVVRGNERLRPGQAIRYDEAPRGGRS